MPNCGPPLRSADNPPKETTREKGDKIMTLLDVYMAEREAAIAAGLAADGPVNADEFTADELYAELSAIAA